MKALVAIGGTFLLILVVGGSIWTFLHKRTAMPAPFPDYDARQAAWKDILYVKNLLVRDAGTKAAALIERGDIAGATKLIQAMDKQQKEIDALKKYLETEAPAPTPASSTSDTSELQPQTQPEPVAKKEFMSPEEFYKQQQSRQQPPTEAESKPSPVGAAPPPTSPPPTKVQQVQGPDYSVCGPDVSYTWRIDPATGHTVPEFNSAQDRLRAADHAMCMRRVAQNWQALHP